MKADNYTIEIGNYREEGTIFYQEKTQNNEVLELGVAADYKSHFIFKTSVVLYLKTMQYWSNTNKQLSLDEYILVLERVYTFLTSSGYKVKLTSKNWVQ